MTENTTDEQLLSESLDKWLHFATFAELESAADDLAHEMETTDDERRRIQLAAKSVRILTEMDKREKRATTSRNAMIPRMTFRDISDAELVGELARHAADNVMSKMSELAGLRRVVGVGSALGIPVEVVIHGQKKTSDLESVMQDHLTMLLRLGEVIGEIGVQLTELRKTTGGASAEDTDYDESYSRVAAKIQEVQTVLDKETGK